MGDVVKEFFGALDKITDILNLGRLVFYTAAGFPPMLALAMILRTVALENRNYWVQFNSDVVACSKNWGVWLAAMIAGFMIANVVYARYVSYSPVAAGKRAHPSHRLWLSLSNDAYRTPQTSFPGGRL